MLWRNHPASTTEGTNPVHTSRARPAAGALAAIAAALLLATGCGSAHDSQAGAAASSAKAAEHSALANPAVSADMQATETLLLANFQKQIKATPAHPFTAARAAIKDTFPAGDTTAIEDYAVSKASVSMVHSKAARQAWAQQVVTYALGQGASTASPGSASIPGASAPAPTVSGP
jgi:hypothetical protein